ncbi:MAG: GIY-YIG nuclease family protein [Sphingobacteriaceae bacterium]
MGRGGCIYILTNEIKSTLYIGVTSDLRSRIYEHRTHRYPKSFSAKYCLYFCIYYEQFTSIEEAINREKELKKWRREKKEHLINLANPEWRDYWPEIEQW